MAQFLDDLRDDAKAYDHHGSVAKSESSIIVRSSARRWTQKVGCDVRSSPLFPVSGSSSCTPSPRIATPTALPTAELTCEASNAAKRCLIKAWWRSARSWCRRLLLVLLWWLLSHVY